MTPQKGAYVKCNREVEVDSAQVGSLVRCPGCGNDLEVVDPSMLGAGVLPDTEPVAEDDWIDDPIDLSPSEPPLPDEGEQPAGAKEPSTEEEPVVDLLTELPNEKVSGLDSASSATVPFLAPATPSTSSPTAELKKESYQQASGPVLQQTSFDRSNTCRKCGTLLEEKEPVCPNCKTARRAVYVDKKDRRPFSRKGPFGFQLWLDGITKGTKPEDFDWFSALSLVFSIILMGAGLTFFIFAGIAGKIVGPVVAFLGFALFTGLRYWSAARKDPRARIPLLGQITWTVMLFFVRTMQFSKVSDERFLNKNGEEDFGDRDLAAMKNLDQQKIVDLEGTSITDDGLLYLYDCRAIKYLVLRNTEVTLNAVHDLQQTIPRTWIWY